MATQSTDLRFGFHKITFIKLIIWIGEIDLVDLPSNKYAISMGMHC